MAFSLLVLLVPGLQDAETASRDFTVTFTVEDATERVKPVELWVTRDEGSTWRKSSAAGVRIREWGKFDGRSIPVKVTVPADGTYGFYLQTQDGVANLAPAPKTGTPFLRIHVGLRRSRTAGEWLQPRPGTELIADDLILLRWRIAKTGMRTDSVALFYSVDDGPWKPVRRKQRLLGSLLWQTPAEPGARVMLRLTAVGVDDRVRETLNGPYILRRKTAFGVRWIQPRAGERVAARSRVVLEWDCPTEGFEKESVLLASSTDGGATWNEIARDRALRGRHIWDVDFPDGAEVALRVAALDRNAREHEDFLHVKVLPTASAGPEWIQPRPGDALTADQQKILRWRTPAKGFVRDSVRIYLAVDSEPERILGKALPLSGRLPFRIPPAEGQGLRLRLTARNEKGRDVETLVEGLSIVASPVPILRWLSPSQPGVWTGGETVRLQWTSLREDLLPRSVGLFYSADGGGRWVLVTKGLEASGFYLWTVPWRSLTDLRLKLTATTRGGKAVETVSPAVTVAATARPDIAQAKRHADRARILAAQSRVAEAVEEYGRALAIWPEYPEALNDLGTLYAGKEEYAKGLEYFLRAKKASPSSSAPYVNAASMEIRLGLTEEALGDLADAVELGVDRNGRLALQAAERLWTLVKLYRISGESRKARRAAALILRIRLVPRAIRKAAEDYLAAPGKR